ncbi:DUF6449 domain-containing protein [Anoxybacillus rupiensis]|uniref:DUF6449 domain-containing protein n=1 Tax=Anoxybacteroides rupiense TaxID=311460 RepID=A0ABD5IVD0_9BACL|nr:MULTISPECIES: DUF6449 domain-containing protein [Anoxybacillus]KXG09356.1 hypothetical protein AT864_02310 [Anoxybacillus sp. P3H1B]MBS2771852.1 ABC transporter permease [Anoxybacillus rupiensis]MDE8563785.1 DUF6449 domain-containing protein [Anoxybacillus rupiensis]MED5051381.1 DUF6449 domain-containing protein [Anoxybacillus rupiensis]OQM46089.1 multidrug ABC transporter permease [Anoxybacillus sp. UARK-01]
MLSKALWFNRSIWLQHFRNIGWIAIVHLLLLLAIVPLPIMMAYTNGKNQLDYLRGLKNVFDISAPFQGMLVFTIPVLLGIFLFRYMHVKQSADYMHSLPFRRESLFTQHMMLGGMILLVPLVFTALVVSVLCYWLPLDRIASADIVLWIAEVFLMEMFVFAVSVFVGMLTGISVLQGIFAYILFLFPAGIFVLVLTNMRYVLAGFAADYYLNANIEKIVPFIRFIELSMRDFSLQEAIGYLFLTGLCIVMALWMYRKRPSEAANQALAFPILRPVFLFGVPFCFMLVGGIYFREVMNGSFGWILFGYMVFSIIGFLVAEMVIEKTWRVFHKWKGYVYFLLPMLLVGTVLYFDLTGYEKRMPKLADIEKVYFGDSVSRFDIDTQQRENHSLIEQPNQFLSSKENIQNVYIFHEQLIANKPTLPSPFADTKRVVIGYVLKNGDRLIRVYDVPTDPYMPFYKQIIESNEYKQNYYFILREKEVAPIRQVTIMMGDERFKEIVLSDPKEISGFMEGLKNDLRQESAESILKNHESWGTIELLQSDGDIIYVTWKKTYANIEKWLSRQKLLPNHR